MPRNHLFEQANTSNRKRINLGTMNLLQNLKAKSILIYPIKSTISP